MRRPKSSREFRAWRGARAWAGIYFGPAALHLAVARPGGEELNVLRQATADYPSPGEEPVEARLLWQNAALALRPQLEPRDQGIVTAMAAEGVMCHSLELPSTDPAELRQMLALQIDSLIPLPVEDAVYSYEPLEVSDGQTRMLVAVAPKAKVTERVEALESVGLPPEVVTVDALVIVRALLRKRLLPRDQRLNALVLLGPAASTVVLHTGGVVRGLYSLMIPAASLANGESRANLLLEFQRILLSASLDLPERPPGQIAFAAVQEEWQSLAGSIAAEFGEPGVVVQDGLIQTPALALCQEMVAGGSSPLNLLPEEVRQKRQVRRIRKNFLQGLVAVGILYVMVLLLFLSLMALRRARLQSAEAELQRLQAPYREARRQHEELVAMEKQLDTKGSAIEVLREVAARMPDGLKLSAFIFRKDQTVTLRGQTQSATAAYDFISSLEKCELFVSVKTVSVKTEGGGLTKFEVLATFLNATMGGGSPANVRQ